MALQSWARSCQQQVSGEFQCLEAWGQKTVNGTGILHLAAELTLCELGRYLLLSHLNSKEDLPVKGQTCFPHLAQ